MTETTKVNLIVQDLLWKISLKTVQLDYLTITETTTGDGLRRTWIYIYITQVSDREMIISNFLRVVRKTQSNVKEDISATYVLRIYMIHCVWSLPYIRAAPVVTLTIC